MTELKGTAADRFIAKPDRKLPIILIHGPDRGRVQTRARALVVSLLGADHDPMACVELDPTLLDGSPSRIAEEADSLSMFGGDKVILARIDDPKGLVKPVEMLLASPPAAASIVIAAGDLKKTHPLRSRIEKSANGVAIACYAADRKDIAALLAKQMEAFDLHIDQQTRDLIIGLLGADFALAANEIEKLCLFARSEGTVTEAHVTALLCDSSVHGFSDVADLAFAGRRDDALDALERTLADGMEASVLWQMMLRHAQHLERMRIDIDAGSAPDTVIGRARPMIFFKRRSAVERALNLWRAEPLRRCIAQMDGDLADLRLKSDLKTVRMERQVLRIASLARSRTL